jgi:hypothetical protein
MEILNFSDQEGSGSKKRSRSRAFIGFGVIAAAVGLSSTLAANISINSGPVEFGQGVAQTVACSGDESIIVTPATSFTNAPSSVTKVATFYGGDTFTVASTADLAVGMGLSNFMSEYPFIITEINGLVVRMSGQGLSEGNALSITFTPSSGTEQKLTPREVDGDPYAAEIGESSMVLDSTSIEVGMLVSGPEIPANTTVVYTGVSFSDLGEGIYIELSKDTTYSEGDGELTFTNSGQSSFKLSDITVSGIPDTCNGKVFTIKLYDNESAEPIVVTDFSEPGYGEDSAIQVYWGNGYISDMPPSYAMIHFENYQWFLDNRDFDGECIDTVGTCLETSDTEGSNLPSNAFKVILPAPVNATRVYKVTVESQDDASTFTSYPDVSNGDTSFTSSFEDFFIDYIRPSWND